MTEETDEHKPPALPPYLESEWLGVTLHSIGDGVIAVDQDGNVTFLNPVAESLVGWKSDEALGKHINDIFRIYHEESQQPVEVPVIESLREGTIAKLSNHIVLIAKDGSRRPISDSAAPIRDQEGQIVGAVLVFRDMSAQRRQVKKIEDAREYAESILSTLRHPFLVLDNQLSVISANKAFYRTFEVDQEETVGNRLYDLGSGQWDIPDLRRLLEEILPENSSFEDFEVEHEFPSIGHRFMLLNARTIHRDGNADLILLGIEDITDQRRLERERQAIEMRFTSLVKNIRDHAIFTLDLDGRISSWNREAERILGFSEEEALGQQFDIIFTAKDQEMARPQEEIDQAKEHGRAEDERWHRRKDGSEFWALGIVTPMYADDGTHVGYSKILRDITDRKRDHDAIKEADQRKTEFLAMLSHELRNPLAPIRTGLDLLRFEKENPDSVEEICDLMQRQTKQLTSLVDDLLNVSRITRGKLQLRKEKVVLSEIMHSAVESVQDLVDEGRHQLEVDIPSTPIALHADPHRLTQVVSNLLSNAAKYTPNEGQIQLAAQLDGDHVLITVQDNGEGIPAEQQATVFEMFSQGNHNESKSGLGIGLALVKSLVDMHQGEISLASDGAGCGTTATVRLPIESVGKPDPPQTEVPPELPGLRILVVDDNETVADMLGLLLQKMDYNVHVAYDGEAAIEKAAQFHPDVIVLDLGMPAMDGYETARRVRQQPWADKLTLIALTGWSQNETKTKAREAGFDHHLVKPPDTAELRKLLDDVESRR